MARQIITGTTKFRDKFVLPNVGTLQWYPGHMNKGMDQIQARLKDTDAVLEVHDARIPFSGRNTKLREIIKLRPHILILNKADLTNKKYNGEVKFTLQDEGVTRIFHTDSKHNKMPVKIKEKIFPSIFEEINRHPRYNRTGIDDYHIMVIGVPNVGKSTVLNMIRSAFLAKGKAAATGARCGITTSVMNRVRVSFEPSVFVLDTPGILTPKFSDIEAGMRLALCNCLPQHLVGEELIVDYLLYWINKNGHSSNYMTLYDLKEPTDNGTDFLAHVALQKQLVRRFNTSTYVGLDKSKVNYVPDFKQAAICVLKDFNSGLWGRFLLDKDKVNFNKRLI